MRCRVAAACQAPPHEPTCSGGNGGLCCLRVPFHAPAMPRARPHALLPASMPRPRPSVPRFAGFASALEMQLEGLQDRLQYLQLSRAAPPSSHGAAAAAAATAEAQQLRRDLAAAQQQNRTLRAAAARLSKALTAVIQRAAAADAAAAGGCAARGKAHGSGAAGVMAAAGAAAEVLSQLTAVEGILGEML